MSPLFGTDVVLFSPMQGKLTYNGQPAANAKIVRHLVWKDDKGEKETFYTNSNGEFNLPIRREKVKIPALGEFVITQELVVFYEDQQFEIWGISKYDIEEYGELGGKLENFRCELTDELTDELRFPEIQNGLFGTSCTWDAIVKKGD